MPDRTCSVDGCDQTTRARGFCRKHYKRWWRYGDPLAAPPRARPLIPTIEERFWSKVDKGGDCWLWKASHNTKGYGHVKVGGRLVLAHRWAYESIVGPIAEGLQIDHLCRVRACVNPAHLEPVSNRENVLRGRRARTGGM